MSGPFRKEDIEEITARGITLEQALGQIEMLSRGSSYARLQRPCTVGDGIHVIEERDLERLGEVCSQAALSGKFMKFVPASGAASRMFQELLSVRSRLEVVDRKAVAAEVKKGASDAQAVLRFFAGIKSFAFYDDLGSAMSRDGMDVEALIARGQYKQILDYLLTGKGLHYGSLPKGLIKFHRYEDHSRTPFEEHLLEAPDYIRDGEGICRIHFTVSREHKESVERHVRKVLGRLEKSGSKWRITFSVQEPSTDTLSVDLHNRPVRDRDGRLMFRPGGHGALLKDLSDLGGEMIFIKNIDNVVPDRLKGETALYKKALGGYLVELQREVFAFLERLSAGVVSDRLIAEALEFARRRLSVVVPREWRKSSKDKKVKFLLDRLNRPLRVCGMVRARGEVGGGPFWVRQGREVESLQIVESAQVNMESARQRAIWESSTHFNPVDLVCAVRDFRGRPFELGRFVDPKAYFISLKFKDGKPIKALELPGLWNGSMAHWSSAFVEVPAITFNPVKTVFDLLREEHQPG